jgi:hypothetical protein
MFSGDFMRHKDVAPYTITQGDVNAKMPYTCEFGRALVDSLKTTEMFFLHNPIKLQSSADWHINAETKPSTTIAVKVCEGYNIVYLYII